MLIYDFRVTISTYTQKELQEIKHMAFDGITVANLQYELQHALEGGRISKIAQPETDELILTVKSAGGNYRLFISASASLPLLYLTQNNKPSPLTAPGFCMLLRKHIGGGRIVSITQPGLERILCFHIEHLDEMGDLCRKKLIVELMGKHSNIIFCDENDRIIDSIKHVSANMSSVREVLPGRTWFIPDTQSKADPWTVSQEDFVDGLREKPMNLSKALYQSLTGISPILSEELCYRAGLDSFRPAGAYTDDELAGLYMQLSLFMMEVKKGNFAPQIVYEHHEPKEYISFPYQIFLGYESSSFSSISEVLERYYAEKNIVTRMRQKSADLRKIVQSALERNQRKLQLQTKQMQDTQKMDKYRIYGELIHTYGYSIEPGAKSFEAVNYYTNEMVTVPLDPQLTPAENAKKYFDRYGKLKRTKEALTTLLQETKEEIEHLDTILMSMDFAMTEADLSQIRQELSASGYIKKHAGKNKRERTTSRPFHYISSDGFDIYVGKNNIQNEELTFKTASGNDWWFHAKGQAGSHVIVKCGNTELPDRTFEEAASLAAWYSKGRKAPKVDIDYIQKKHVKKVNGAKPGFVIYHTNYSMTISPDISSVRLAEE